jgi:hypothetical protein
MKQFTSSFVFPILLLLALGSCQKEYSVEGGGGASSAVGTLGKDAFGGCLPINVAGVYKKDSTLGNGNFVEIQVAVTTPGSYIIGSDTVNGYHFRATGVFSLPGSYTVRLLGNGRPLANRIDAFVASFGGSECFFEVTVATATSGGGGGTSNFLEAQLDGAVNSFNNSPSALLISGIGVQSLTITGTSSTGRALTLNVSKTNTLPITAGIYTVNQISTGIVLGCVYAESVSAVFSAQSNPVSTQNPAFTIEITSISSTRVVGTFLGPVKDNNGAGPGTKTLTQGRFDVPIL